MTTEKQQGRNLVDIETGQLYEDVAVVRTNKQLKIIDNEKRLKAFKESQGTVKQQFSFSYQKKIQEVYNKMDLTLKQIGYMVILSAYTDYDNMLKLTPESNVPMTKKELGAVLNISRNVTIDKLLRDLIKGNVLTVKTVKRYGKEHEAYFLSRDIFFKNNAAEKKKVKGTVRTFDESIKAVYAEGNTKPADIGFIWITLQYVNIHHNFLTHNVDEADPSKDEKITILELSKLLGLDEKETRARISGTKFNGMYVYSRITVGRSKTIKMNPLVANRQKGIPDLSSYVEFKLK